MKLKHLAYAVAFTLVITGAPGWPSLGSGWAPPRVSAQGAGGTLDPDFGSGGKVTTDFAGGTDQAFAVAVQQNGKIMVAGVAFIRGTDADFALARYNSDGTLDPTFGSGGKVATDFAGSDDRAAAIALQPNGKIVVAGQTYAGATGIDFALARYDSDGTLDPTFGSGGKVRTDFLGGFDQAFAVGVQQDGKIVAVGVTDTSTNADFGLARYNSDGTLDPDFGSGGKVTTDFAGNGDGAVAMALQPNGKIVAAGGTFTGFSTGDDFGLARYNSDGTLDTSFGAGGKVTTDFGISADGARVVAIQKNGNIVATGHAFNAGTGDDFGLARYNSDGTLDTSFGAGGKVTTDFGGSGDTAFAVAVMQNGKIVAAGGADNDFALAQYNKDGMLDPTFGSGGKVTTDFAGSFDVASAVAMLPGGQIVAAGQTFTGATFQDFALARYE